MTITTMPKTLDKYATAWSILAAWDATLGGKLPSAANIADAIAVMSKPGGKPAVLNQGLRAFALGFRAEGSTDGQRSYASMSGQPHNNVGKLGDALRSQTAGHSSRLEVGTPVTVTLPGGKVTVSSNKAGHVHFEVAERFTAPVAPTTDAAKAPKAKTAKKRKAKTPEALASGQDNAPVVENQPHPDDLSEGLHVEGDQD